MSKPVLANIPSAYKSGTLYSVLPNNGDGDFTFSRTGSATRVNKDGIIETVGSNVPRLDYSDGTCPALLLEPQRTNLITYSESFSSWSASRASVSSDISISPTGELNADKLIEDNTLAQHRLDLGTTSAIGVNTFSVFVKKAERDFVWLRIGSAGAVFDLTNGSNNIIFGLDDAYSQDFGNGWYRCVIVRTSTSANEICRINISNSITPLDYQGDGVSGIYIFGAQLEEGDYATSYIPTTGSAVTRSLDYCYDGGNSDLFNVTEGTLFYDIIPYKPSGSTIYAISLNDGGLNNSVNLIINNSSGATAFIRYNNVTVFDSTKPIDVFQRNKIVITFKENEFKYYINGVLLTTDTSGSIPIGLDNLEFSRYAGTIKFEGKVYDTRFYNTVLTEAEAIQLTTL